MSRAPTLLCRRSHVLHSGTSTTRVGNELMLRIADTDVLGATLDANAERMLFGSPEQPGQTPASPKIL